MGYLTMTYSFICHSTLLSSDEENLPIFCIRKSLGDWGYYIYVLCLILNSYAVGVGYMMSHYYKYHLVFQLHLLKQFVENELVESEENNLMDNDTYQEFVHSRIVYCVERHIVVKRYVDC